jgi:tetratricopeptide (TPR) repeat protein
VAFAVAGIAPSRIALAEPPANAGASLLVERGARYEAENRLAEALSAYTEALQLDPSDGSVLVALGRLRVKMHDLGEAEMLFTTATKFRDVESDALVERARLRRSEGRDAEAIRDLEDAVALGPGTAGPTEELAAWYSAHRAWLAALTLWRRVAFTSTDEAEIARAKLEIRALGVLAAELDPVAAGAAGRASFTRRALARLARR